MLFKQNTILSEQEIIEGCKQGKHKHQTALYQLFSAKMFSVCLRYAGDYHRAEDVLQDGFIRVLSNIDKYRGEGSFEGWIRRIFINTAIENQRKNTLTYEITDPDGAELHVYDETTIDHIAADDLLRFVQNLSPGYRSVFNLYAIEGYTHKEIAEMLNITEGTSKSQLARARGLLQQKLAEHYPQSVRNHGQTT